jgi:hypothetical protein
MSDTSQNNHADKEQNPLRAGPLGSPAGSTEEDSDAAEIMRRTLENWPSYTPGDDQ